MRQLKWKPKISIKEGIKILISNIDYWKSPVWTPKKIKNQQRNGFKYLS